MVEFPAEVFRFWSKKRLILQDFWKIIFKKSSFEIFSWNFQILIKKNVWFYKILEKLKKKKKSAKTENLGRSPP